MSTPEFNLELDGIASVAILILSVGKHRKLEFGFQTATPAILTDSQNSMNTI